MLYSSDRVFKFWAYSVSHSFLLIRSTNWEENDEGNMIEGFNIDIEFVGVGYLDIPVILKGLSIRELDDDIPEKFSGYPRGIGYKVFEISADKQYYIVAGNCVVGKNTWQNDDRMNNPALEYDEIIAISDKW